MYKTVILIMCTALQGMAQIKLPNGDFNQFETVSVNSYSYNLPVGWKEHQKNEYWRSRGEYGFVSKYGLPDANEYAVALHRGAMGSHLVEENATFSSFSVFENCENVRLVGRYKFSGSDIEEAIDTLRIVAFSTPQQLQNLPDQFPQNATYLNIVAPTSQFEWFQLDLNAIETGIYLTLVFQLKSGSDDNYYWGYANAVIDDLELIIKDNL